MEKQITEFIAYKGQCFTIEWFYDEDGKSEAYDYYKQLPVERRQKLLVLLKRLGDTGKIFDLTKFRHEGDQIYAFKPRPDRFLCFFFVGKKAIITNAFEKKTDKLPKQEKRKALTYKENYEQRINKENYYENL